MNEYGVTRYCLVCSREFNTIEGDIICSSECAEEWENMNYDDELDEFGDNDF